MTLLGRGWGEDERRETVIRFGVECQDKTYRRSLETKWEENGEKEIRIVIRMIKEPAVGRRLFTGRHEDGLTGSSNGG